MAAPPPALNQTGTEKKGRDIPAQPLTLALMFTLHEAITENIVVVLLVFGIMQPVPKVQCPAVFAGIFCNLTPEFNPKQDILIVLIIIL